MTLYRTLRNLLVIPYKKKSHAQLRAELGVAFFNHLLGENIVNRKYNVELSH